ncbi:retrovirus-related Pol polyprotein from transposon TNT 1-94 [Trichonephila clavipes]|uniref:Retrovirus-related Pol polyprotein from transposon TNT 1-94 n=1 Tax=Trichonephila clavipes TaxID=2585209 RepID=A0A8X6RUN0_TRICX|nr:retrovirus-related Pol polyprotein from transposon TNT 1-94 [Trichonephila clavipes]
MRAKLGIMLGYALSTKGYRIWLIEENKVIETINVRFDEGKRGVDSEKTFMLPARNYLLKDFPEDGDMFSAVGDRANHPEAGSERDTRPGGADSESQTGVTHILRSCASIIYYFVEGSNVRLRSFNEVQKYCKYKNIDYDQNLFNFSGKNSSSGQVTDLLNLPLEEKANLAEVRIPKTYREATRTAEAADWEGAMDEEMQVMYDHKVWNLVEPPKEANVLGCRWVYSLKHNEIVRYKAHLVAQRFKQVKDDIVMFGETKKDLDNGITLLQGHFDLKILGKTNKLLAFGFVEVRLDDGVTFPAGWCVNRVWVPWMSTSSPRYRLGGGENVICQSGYLGDSGTGSTLF